MKNRVNTLGRMREFPRTRAHLLLIALQLGLAVWWVWFSYQEKAVLFEVADDLEAGVVYVKDADERVGLAPNDVIAAIDGRGIDTTAEFWSAVEGAETSVELTIQRFELPFSRNLTAATFPEGELPPGIRLDDRPVGMACQGDGAYVELKAVDLEGLRHLVRERGAREGLVVTFLRPFDERVETFEIERSGVALWPVALCLLGALLMGLVLVQSSRRRSFLEGTTDNRGLYLSALLLTASLSVTFLSAGPRLLASPGLYTLGAIGLAFFKALDIEFHLRSRAVWSPLDRLTRIAIFAGPIVFLLQLLYHAFGLVRLSLGNDLGLAEFERLNRTGVLLCGMVVVLVVIDTALVLVRHYQRGEDASVQAVGSRMGLGFSVLFALSAVYLYARADTRLAMLLLAVAIGVQVIGDLASLFDLPKAYWRSSDSEALSPAPIQRFAAALEVLFPDRNTYLVVSKSAFGGKSVRVSLAPPGSPVGLRREVAPDEWTDFLDILRTEGGLIPAANSSDDPELDPMTGMARQLGIELAWPLSDSVAGTSARVVLVIRGLKDPDDSLDDGFELGRDQHNQLVELLRSFPEVAPALVFQATEAMPLSVEGPLERVVATPPSAQAAPVADDDDLAAFLVDRVDQLGAQVAAFKSELDRIHPIEELDPTESQRGAIESVLEVGCPVLLVGEPAVGKTIVARLAHEEMGGGPFVRVNAAERPQAVLEMELFGDDEELGMIVAAFGGSLLIEGAHSLMLSSFERLLEKLDDYEDRAPRLFLSADVGNATTQLVLEDEDEHIELDDALSMLVDRADAEIVYVPPLRAVREELPRVADYFLHRASMHHERVLTGFEEATSKFIEEYVWPGNFREMCDAIERGVVVCKGETLRLSDLFAFCDPTANENDRVSEPAGDAPRAEGKGLRAKIARLEVQLAEQEALLSQVERPGSRADGVESLIPLTGDVDLLSGTYEGFERRLLEVALERADGNKSEAARALELKRSTFVNKLKKHGMAT